MSGFQHIGGIAARIVLDVQLKMTLRERGLTDGEIEAVMARVNESKSGRRICISDNVIEISTTCGLAA